MPVNSSEFICPVTGQICETRNMVVRARDKLTETINQDPTSENVAEEIRALQVVTNAILTIDHENLLCVASPNPDQCARPLRCGLEPKIITMLFSQTVTRLTALEETEQPKPELHLA